MFNQDLLNPWAHLTEVFVWAWDYEDGVDFANLCCCFCTSIYACFDRILQLGIKHLYMDTKDITELKKARMRRTEEAKKKELFQFNASQEQE